MIIGLGLFLILWTIAVYTRFWRGYRWLRVVNVAILIVMTAFWGFIGAAILLPDDCDSTPRLVQHEDGSTEMYVDCLPPGASVEVPLVIPIPTEDLPIVEGDPA